MPRTLTYQAGLLTLSRSAGAVLNALAGILIVRSLTQFDYGTYRQLILIFSTLSVTGDLGFSQSLFHFVSRQRERTGVFLGQALLAVLVMGSILTVALLTLSGPLSRSFGNTEITFSMGLLSVYIFVYLLNQVLEASLISLERIGTTAASIGILETTKFPLILAALWWRGTISSVLWAMVIAAVARLVYLYYQMRSEIRFAAAEQFLEQFRYAMSLWLPGLLNVAGVYAHQYIVSFYTSPAQFAIYAVACFQIPLLGILSSSVAEVVLVRTTKCNSDGRQEEIYQVWLNACRKALLVFLPVTVGLAVLARPLILALFTARYAASVPLFVVLLMSLPFSALFQDSLLRAYGAMRTYSFFYVLRATLSIGLGALGIWLLGMWGVALSTVATFAIINVWQLMKLAELMRVSFAKVLAWKDIGKALLVSAVAALPAVACTHFIPQPGIALGAGLALFGTGYLVLALRFHLVSSAEKRMLLEEARAGFARLGFLGAKAV